MESTLRYARVAWSPSASMAIFGGGGGAGGLREALRAKVGGDLRFVFDWFPLSMNVFLFIFILYICLYILIDI